MVLTKQAEKELLLVYNSWWESYLNGDVPTYDSFLDDDFRFVGSTDGEEFLNRIDSTSFFKATAGQFAGKLKLENNKRSIEPLEGFILITDLADTYILDGTDWVYYARFRFTSFLRKTSNGWRFFYQHFSTPDLKADDGETIGLDKITSENLELRNAIKRATVELELKNRDLEIEAALERVRARTMAMHNSSELGGVASLLFEQIRELDIEVWTTGFNVWLDDDNVYEDWITSPKGGFIEPYKVDTTEFPVFIEVREAKQRGDAFFVQYVEGEMLKGMYQQLSDFAPAQFEKMLEDGLQFPKHQYDHFVFGTSVSLMFITFEPLLEAHDIFKRFGKVFQQTYTRFLDLQKAEAQAREAKIEVALEKVRSRTMAMQRSDELLDAATVLFQEVKNLGVPQWNCGFNIWELGDKEFTYYPGSPDGVVLPSPCKISFDEHPVFMRFDESRKRGEELLIYEKEGEEQADHYNHMLSHPSVGELLQNMLDSGYEFPKSQVDHLANFSYGNLIFITYEHFPEMHEVFKRFAKVFEQTYTRFLDLQKSEAQAREAKIEVALERVRARSMAMHRTDELADTAMMLFAQVTELGIDLRSCGFLIMDDEKQAMEDWSANIDEHGKSVVVTGTLAYDQHPILAAVVSAWRKGDPYIIAEVHGDDLQKYYKAVTTKESTTKAVKNKVLAKATSEYTNSFYFKYGMMYVLTPKPISDHEINVLMRFAGVFKLTYRRFLDIEQAENQAREAQIEAALERVRSHTMGMQKSKDLFAVTAIFHEQALQFSTNIHNSGFNINYKDTDGFNLMMADSFNTGRAGYAHIPYIDHPIYNEVKVAKEKGLDFVAIKLSFEEKNIFWKHFFNYFEPETEEQKEGLLAAKGFTISIALLDNVTFYFVNYDGIIFSEEENDLVKRFGATFQQAYTRFLDLQKAEKQARESQIEAALERVRSKTMAMHNSEDVGHTVVSLFDEVLKLGLDKTIRCGLGILENREHMETWSANLRSNGEVLLKVGKLSMDVHPMLKGLKKAWKSGQTSYSYDFTKGDVHKYYKALNDEPEYEFNANLENLPKNEYHNSFFFSSGILFAFTENPLSEEGAKVLDRFSDVFGQTYRRYLDLRMAEAQAKEAQIEAALEKVRSRSLAMQKSNDLLVVIKTISEQLYELNIRYSNVSFGIDSDDSDYIFWTSISGQSDPVKITVPYIDHPIIQAISEARKNKQNFLIDFFPAEIHRIWLNHAIEHSALKSLLKKEKENLLNLPLTRSAALLPNIFLVVANYKDKPYSDTDNAIIARFGQVFEQSYRRFLDLEKAEAQAREAQIEAALERVRASSMAMHKSEQLAETAEVLFEQFNLLGVIPDRISIGIYNEKKRLFELWATDQSGMNVNHGHNFSIDEPTCMAKTYKAWKKGNETFVVDLQGKDLKNWVQFVKEEAKMELDESQFKGRRVQHCAFFSQGYLLLSSHLPISDGMMQLLLRFAKVFQQTYTRFLDLQKAEAQARESQIETALERVRSRSMGMQESKELHDVIQVIYDQLTQLDFNIDGAGFATDFRESNDWNLWIADRINPSINQIHIPYFDHPMSNAIIEAKKNGQELLVVNLTFEDKNKLWEQMFKYVKTPKKVQDAIFSYPGYVMSKVLLDRVDLYMSNSSGYLYTDKENDTLLRFGKVFEQTYVRFNDLKNAEERAKEALKQSSLDRLRAKIASMRTATDLEQIIPSIWNELNILGVSFIRCGVFIMNEENQSISTYLSARDGKALAAFELPYKTTEIAKKAVLNWRKNKFYQTSWSKSEFISFMKSLVDQGLLKDRLSYQGAENPPDQLYLNFAPFKQGMLYVANVETLSNEQLDLVQTLAKAFSIAYARYEDFNKLELANIKIEKTLIDLKQAQSQLVQSEKMASLGELTAGIAHEIQNPLNFVNNFSEVSQELMTEMNEELDRGDIKEAKDIGMDIEKNLEKINRHGKRASDIVKGMLQHSRSSSGINELTDINTLVDEYLRLSYHGLRAKNKSFNADFKADLDKKLPQIKVVPQDFGRVILNLINNAFYAVNEKAKGADKSYRPTVVVQTKKIDKKIEISVKDNGNGIPKDLADKIFQPFFTTKPTGQGTGLGLSLSYDIVKAHGGELKVETNEGEGSQFLIILPV